MIILFIYDHIVYIWSFSLISLQSLYMWKITIFFKILIINYIFLYLNSLIQQIQVIFVNHIW